MSVVYLTGASVMIYSEIFPGLSISWQLQSDGWLMIIAVSSKL